jgi:hypothetical protein
MKAASALAIVRVGHFFDTKGNTPGAKIFCQELSGKLSADQANSPAISLSSRAMIARISGMESPCSVRNFVTLSSPSHFAKG